MAIAIILVFVILALLIIGYWWRHYSLTCPANLSWLVENPYVNAVASPDRLLQRLNIAEGMKILDVGSGPGRLTIPASLRIGNKGEVVALDIQDRMLEKLKRKIDNRPIHNIRLIHAGVGEGKLETDYFDRALLVTVLGEIHDKHKALTEIYEALKSNGILSITELIPDPHYTSRSHIRSLCAKAGFKESDSFGNWFCFTINFVKPENQQQNKSSGK